MRIVLLQVLLSIPFLSYSQTGYKFDFVVKGWADSAVYLAHYYGETIYVTDTAQVNRDGTFTFQKKSVLPQGVYFLVRKSAKGNNRFFDFVVGSDQTFSLETDASNFLAKMKVTGDEDNRLFFENIAYNIDRNKQGDPLIKVFKDSLSTEEQKKAARASFSKINDQVVSHQKQLIRKHPLTLTARMLKAAMQVAIPDAPRKANGQIDSTFQLKYYRQHFFDNFDLADGAMLRMPQQIYQQKIKEYFEKLFVPHPDSVAQAIDFVIAKAKKNQETYQYCVSKCASTYFQPEIMGLDEVFVHIYDRYFSSGEMDFWANAKMKENLKEHADKIRSCMIGRVGPNLIMQDENFQPRSMYDIRSKYTILFIFDPDCGHCRQETPKLLDFYEKNRLEFNLDVFAVSTDTSMKKMRDFIKEFKTPWITVDGPRSYLKVHFQKLYHSDTTPTIYILDDQKKIIAKKLPVGQLQEFLRKHERFVRGKQTATGKANER